MNLIENWGDVFASSLQGVWFGVASFIPNLIVAIVIFAIGWVLASLIQNLVESVFKTLKVDAALKSAGLEDVVKRSGYTLSSGTFIGVLVKWFIIVVFLIASFDVLGLNQVTLFLKDVLNYLPNVIVAVLILMVSVIIANAMQKIVVASARAGQVRSAELLGRITKWSIWIFAVLAALLHLGIAPGLIQTLITAIFAGTAIAFGLAFGLGGKDAAQKMIERTLNTVTEKE
ncbi:MAG: hypothetical protein M3Q80_01465 [bacterium]|nr:hypothetical protein [bacterium]